MQTLSLNICFSSDIKGAEVRGHTDRALGGPALALNKRTPSLLGSCHLPVLSRSNDPSDLRVISACMIVFCQSDCLFTSGSLALSSIVGQMTKVMMKIHLSLI